MQDSLFTKIIKGEIPCHKIYEDEHTLAFLDINPVQPGHTLVIPKSEVEFVWDLSEEDHAALYKTVKHVGLRLKEVMGRPYVGEMVVGNDVPHAHVHVVPFSIAAELKRNLEPHAQEPNHEELAKIAAKLAF